MLFSLPEMVNKVKYKGSMDHGWMDGMGHFRWVTWVMGQCTLTLDPCRHSPHIENPSGSWINGSEQTTFQVKKF